MGWGAILLYYSIIKEIRTLENVHLNQISYLIDNVIPTLYYFNKNYNNSEILIEINYYAHRILHEPHYIHATSLTQKERNE